MDPILLIVCIGIVGGVIVWAFYKLFKGTDEDIDGAIGGEDVTLLATGMQDPSLAVAAYTVGEALDDSGTDDGDDDTQVDLSPLAEVAAAAVITSEPESVTPEPTSTSVAEKVWTHTEAPEPAHTHISESVFTHHESAPAPSHDYSSSSSYDSGGSSSCGGGDCGGCGGGD